MNASDDKDKCGNGRSDKVTARILVAGLVAIAMLSGIGELLLSISGYDSAGGLTQLAAACVGCLVGIAGSCFQRH